MEIKAGICFLFYKEKAYNCNFKGTLIPNFVAMDFCELKCPYKESQGLHSVQCF